jgi:hypothetical protein
MTSQERRGRLKTVATLPTVSEGRTQPRSSPAHRAGKSFLAPTSRSRSWADLSKKGGIKSGSAEPSTSGSRCQIEAVSPRPNIVFVLMDNLGYGVARNHRDPANRLEHARAGQGAGLQPQQRPRRDQDRRSDDVNRVRIAHPRTGGALRVVPARSSSSPSPARSRQSAFRTRRPSRTERIGAARQISWLRACETENRIVPNTSGENC